MGTNRTLGILFNSLVSWMRWTVLHRWGERRTGVAAVAVGIGRRGIVGMIGCTRFVDFSAHFVVGFCAFIMGGTFDI
jgi:hypothetical protein